MKRVIILISLVILTSSCLKAQTKNYDSLLEGAIKEKDTSTAVSYLLKKIQEVNPDSLGDWGKLVVNNQLFNYLFKYTKNRDELLSGAVFMKKLITDKDSQEKISKKAFATYVDTYANLLYKAGKVKDAIKWEQKGLDFAPPDAKQEFIDNLEKMKKRVPTW